MLKGTRTGIVHRIQPMSIHGQISLDVFWTDPEDPEGEIRHARVGNEATPTHMAVGDTIVLHYLMGMVTEITSPSASGSPASGTRSPGITGSRKED